MSELFREAEGELGDDSYQIREVFAQYGLAVYTAGVLEKGLVNVAALARTDAIDGATRDDFDTVFEKLTSGTMGSVLRRLEPFLEDDVELLDDLRATVRRRNHLARSFFWEHSVRFTTTEGREEMLSELHQLTHLFEQMDKRLAPVVDSMLLARGIDTEQKERLIAEAMDSLVSGTVGPAITPPLHWDHARQRPG